MAEIASLSLEVRSDQVRQANLELRQMPQAASAAERAAQRWGMTTDAASRSTEQFSRRVQRTIRDLEFERQQLTRSAAERERFNALRRAGVSAASAEGQALSATIAALQAQRAANEQASKGTNLQIVTSKAASSAYGFMLRTLAPLAAALSAAAIATKIWDTAMEVADFGEKADQIGMTVEAMQALQFSAVQNGLSIEQLETGVGKFSQKIGEAADGSKEMIEALGRIGVKILDVQGNLRPTEDLLFEVAKKITAIDDPARKSAAAVDFFGKAGTKMIPMLADMAKGQDSLADTARRAGAMIDKELIEKLDAFSDRLSRGALKWRASFAELAVAALDFGEKIQNSFDKAFPSDESSMQKRRDAWQHPIEDFFDWVGDSFRTLIAAGAGFSAGFVEAFSGLGDKLKSVFAEAMDKAIGVVESGINAVRTGLSNAKSWFGNSAPLDPVRLGRIGPQGSDLSPGALTERVAAAQKAAEEAALAGIPNAAAARKDARFATRQMRMQADEEAARAVKLPGVGGAAGAGNPAAKGGGSDPYAKAIESGREYILTKKAEIAAIGQNVFEAARLKHEQELLNKAMNDGKTVTEAQKTALQSLAQGMAEADAEMATAKFMDDANKTAQDFIANQELQARSLGMTAEAAAAMRYEQDLLNKAQNDNIPLTDAQRAALAALAQQMASSEAATKRLSDIHEFAKDVVGGFFTDINKGLQDGAPLWETFGNAAMNVLNKISDKLMQMATDKLFEAAFGGSSGGGGGFLSGILGSLFGGGSTIGGTGGVPASAVPANLGIYAKGAAFRAGNVVPFAGGGIVSSPTMFPMAGGRTGLMGEAGDEGILPLRRGRGGRLGVEASGMQSGGDVVINMPVTFGSDVNRAEMGRWVSKLKTEVTQAAITGVESKRRRGGAIKASFAGR